jgi:hypothetical protein
MKLCKLCEKGACKVALCINEILVQGLSEANVERAVMLREMIKQREDMLRVKRQELDRLIYNNMKLLTK